MSHENYLFTESHEWVEATGEVRAVGITDHAQHLLGDIVYTDLPEVGRKVAKGEEIIVVESPKAAADVYAPLSGEIVAVNTDLEGEPGTINKNPYTDGWIVKIKPDNPAAEQATLLTWSKYQDVIGG